MPFLAGIKGFANPCLLACLTSRVLSHISHIIHAHSNRYTFLLMLRIALARLFDRLFDSFGQTVRSPISDPLDQIDVAVAWYRHVIVTLSDVKMMVID
jgi:hypothetical protein